MPLPPHSVVRTSDGERLLCSGSSQSLSAFYEVNLRTGHVRELKRMANAVPHESRFVEARSPGLGFLGETVERPWLSERSYFDIGTGKVFCTEQHRIQGSVLKPFEPAFNPVDFPGPQLPLQNSGPRLWPQPYAPKPPRDGPARLYWR